MHTHTCAVVHKKDNVVRIIGFLVAARTSILASTYHNVYIITTLIGLRITRSAVLTNVCVCLIRAHQKALHGECGWQRLWLTRPWFGYHQWPGPAGKEVARAETDCDSHTFLPSRASMYTCTKHATLHTNLTNISSGHDRNTWRSMLGLPLAPGTTWPCSHNTFPYQQLWSVTICAGRPTTRNVACCVSSTYPLSITNSRCASATNNTGGLPGWRKRVKKGHKRTL